MARRKTHTDAELLQLTATDPEAFGDFYRRWEPAILAWILRRTGRNPDVAVDLTAEVFAAALTGAAGFRPADETGSAASWLFTIARNILVSSIRRGRVEEQARHRLARWEPVDLDAVDIEAIVALASEDGELLRALELLPPSQRVAVRARILEEREYDDIAAELSCSSLVVRKNVSRGLRALRTTTQGRTL
jgi:RNA polymerase sigma-70 factor (ECF subfamily)